MKVIINGDVGSQTVSFAVPAPDWWRELSIGFKTQGTLFGGEAVFFPKSRIRLVRFDEDRYGLTLPHWLYKKKKDAVALIPGVEPM